MRLAARFNATMALSTLAGYSLASRVSSVGSIEKPPQAGRFWRCVITAILTNLRGCSQNLHFDTPAPLAPLKNRRRRVAFA